MKRNSGGSDGQAATGESASTPMIGRSRWRPWVIATLAAGLTVSAAIVSSSATPTTLKASATQAISDTTGDIQGTVYDMGATPLPGICVSVDPGLGGEPSPAMASTDATGAYTLSDLPPGPGYKIRFENNGDCGGTPNSGSWAPQWYDGATTMEDADAVEVTAGTATTGIDAHMTPGGAISGRAFNAETGAPLGGICVVTNLDRSPTATTGPTGAYTLTNLPSGSYQVVFHDGCGAPGSWIAQAWESASMAGPSDTSTAVMVTAPNTTTGIDAALPPAGTITGKVTGTVNNAVVELPSICVSVDQGPGGGGGGGTKTDEHGNYTLTGLTPGHSYVIQFENTCPDHNPGSWVAQWYRGAPSYSTATPVPVPGTTAVTGINALMVAGGTISGTVTGVEAEPGWPFCASVDPGLPNGDATRLRSSTRGDGTYTLNNVAAGQHRVRFEDSCSGVPPEWVTQWYNDSPTFSGSTPVTVTAGADTPDIDATLDHHAGSISGKVTAAAGGQPLSNICVHALIGNVTVRSTLAYSDPSLPSGPASVYTLAGLSPGTYTVTFDSCGGASGSWVTQSASAVVSADTVTPNVDAAMVAIAETYAGPNNGNHLGGTVVTLSGTGFTGATAVTFDGVPGTALTVISDSILQVTAPKHIKATVPVIVITPSGSCPSARAVTFTYT